MIISSNEIKKKKKKKKGKSRNLFLWTLVYGI